MKFIDFLAAIIFLASLPIILIISFFILTINGRPLFYSHQRIGRNGKNFYCYKFRTMKNNIDMMIKNDPKLFKKFIDNDYKIPESFNPYSKIGQFLRKSNIDEIPQIINILKGEMSLVGPRPIVDKEIDHYNEEEKILLLSVKPGITGYWQVNGRNKIKYPERKEYELFYAKNHSFYLDLKIIMQTIFVVLKRDNSIT